MPTISGFLFSRLKKKSRLLFCFFYYASPMYVHVQESNYGVSREVLRYTSSDLLGNVGGWLGLLLGTSVLSLFDPVADSITRMAARA